MAKPVTGLITFGSSPGPDSTGNLDVNYNLLTSALNDLGTYGNFVQDTSGAANSIVAATVAGITASLVAGLPLQVKVANTNTGASTIALNALPATPLVNQDGSAMQAGQLKAGGLYPVEYDGANFQLLGSSTLVSPAVYANVINYGADSTGVADSTTAINNAIAAVSALGGGTVWFPAGTYKVSSAITMASAVMLRGYGATINYTGAGVIFASPATGSTNYASVRGFVINGGTGATTFLQVNSHYSSFFEDLTFLGDSLTSVCMALGFNTTGTPNPVGNLNTAQCFFKNIAQAANGSGKGCGTFLSIAGNSAIQGLPTDNTFINIQAQTCNVAGIVGTQWGDSNIFSGMTRIGLNGNISPANGIGCNIGSTGQGIYSWTMEHLAIDTFGTPAVDNRIGVQISAANAVKNIHIGVLFMGPQNEQNALLAAGVLSYDITVAPRQTSNYQSKHLVGNNVGIGVPANTSVGLIVGAGAWMSGASQNVFFAQGSAINQGSPALGVCYGATPGGVASASPFTIAQVMGVLINSGVNGTNASVTNAYAYYTANQNFATNANFGYYTLQNNNTANDRAFVGAGTAPSVFNAGSAPPAGGAANVALLMTSTAGFGIYAGSGAPTLSAAQGSLYLRTDGSGGTNRAYINTNGSTTWTAIDTVA